MSALRLRPASSWGLDTAPDPAGWRTLGRCTRPDVDPDWWFGTHGQQIEALHLCLEHCPVLAECRAEARRNPPGFGIFGGLAWKDAAHPANRRPRDKQPPKKACGPACQVRERRAGVA